MIQHHYVPNSKLSTTEFSTKPSRIQTSTFLYVGTQIVDGTLLLNNVASVTEGNIEITNVSLVGTIDGLSLTFIRVSCISSTTFSIQLRRSFKLIYPRRPKPSLRAAALTPLCHIAEAETESRPWCGLRESTVLHCQHGVELWPSSSKPE